MKIIIFTEIYARGGVDTFLINLINNWPDKNDNFIIIYNNNYPGIDFIKKRINKNE